MESRFKPTTNGRAALAACIALGEAPHICRVAFGSGKIQEDAELADQHELLVYEADGTIGDRRHQQDHLYLTLQYANQEHPEKETFYLSEFMVYIKDPVTGQETDLLYGTMGDYRLPAPKYHDGQEPWVFNLPIAMVVSDKVQVVIDAPAGTVTYSDLEQAVENAVGDHDRSETAHADLRASVQDAVKTANEAKDAVSGLVGQLLIIGGEEPQTGPVLWFDTRNREQKPHIVAVLGGEGVEGSVTAEVDGAAYPITNAEKKPDEANNQIIEMK